MAAISFYSTAKGYLQGAYLMMNNPLRLAFPNDTTLILSLHLQCGFACELYLKAYLMAKGHTEQELRKQALGHNLLALLHLAKDHGLTSEHAQFLVRHLHDEHVGLGYRYMRDGISYVLAPLPHIFAAFSELDFLVDSESGASVSRGRLPTRNGWTLEEPYIHWRLPNHPSVRPA